MPFAQRADSGKVLETLNHHLGGVDEVAAVGGSTSRVTLSSTRSLGDYKYRIAYERAMERSEGTLASSRTSNLLRKLTMVLALMQSWTVRSTTRPSSCGTTTASTSWAIQPSRPRRRATSSAGSAPRMTRSR